MGKSSRIIRGNRRKEVLALIFIVLCIFFSASSPAVAQNFPPQITSCPTVLEDSHCNTFVFDFDAYDPDGDLLTYYITSGPGIIDAITGVWAWSGATLSDVGFSVVLEVSVSDGQQSENCSALIVVTNTGPILTCPSASITVQTGDTKSQTIGASDDCDLLTYSISDIGGATGAASIDGNGVITYSPAENDGDLNQPVVMTVVVTDGEQSAQCSVSWNVITEAPYSVSLGRSDGNSSGITGNTVIAIPGIFNTMHLGIDRVNVVTGLGGFDLRVVFDASALSFQVADRGNIYDECGWEYFSYRVINPGELNLFGLADMNDGPDNYPGCATPTPYVGVLPTTLSSLAFLAADTAIVGGRCVPVSFYWVDCGDNILLNGAREVLFSAKVTDAYNPIPINDPAASFPTLLGLPQSCIGQYSATRQVDYHNGQFCFAPDCHSLDRLIRGDINDNCFSYEVADLVMFKKFFMIGFAAFEDHVSYSIAATDVNADGVTRSIEDLVYLIRVITGDAPEIYVEPPMFFPVSASYTYESNIMSIGDEVMLGAAHVVVAGNVTPQLLAEGMDMEFAYDAEQNETNILVSIPYILGEHTDGFTGDFLQVSGELVQPPSFSTIEGASVELNLIPRTFELSQNYPNPFNPSTVISISFSERAEYKLTIVNSLGQIVDVFNGSADPGILDIKWDATGLASGVYFYKIEAGDFTATKKAVLLK